MTEQPSFNTPVEAIEFIRACLQQEDPTVLHSGFSKDVSEFWKDLLVQTLREIEATETLERVFLDDSLINTFPEQETVLHLGVHSPRAHYIDIKLVKVASSWVLESIPVCR
jgi:hypothetical protein